MKQRVKIKRVASLLTSYIVMKSKLKINYWSYLQSCNNNRKLTNLKFLYILFYYIIAKSIKLKVAEIRG